MAVKRCYIAGPNINHRFNRFNRFNGFNGVNYETIEDQYVLDVKPDYSVLIWLTGW
jgi:hypothetical protein